MSSGSRGIGVDFQTLPVAALELRDGVVVAANAAYEHLMGVKAGEVVGLTSDSLVAAYVTPGDLPRVREDSEIARSMSASSGSLRLRATDASGRVRALRIEWRFDEASDSSLVFLVDDDHDTRVKELTDGFARASAALATAESETEVVERAVVAIAERGFTASFLIAEEGGAWLRQGPSATPHAGDERVEAQAALETLSVPIEVLRAFNSGFDDGIALFFDDLYPIVERALPGLPLELLREAKIGPRLVEVPLHVGQRLFGVLFVTGDTLTPGLSGPIEMFGELIERAVEAVRMRRRLVERERLAALGEAAAVMAHEVRNPIGSILNAVTLLGRDGVPSDALLPVIAEESRRLERIVSNLLTLGRPLEPKLASVSLVALAGAARDLYLSREADVSVAVQIDESGAGLWASLDPALIELAVLNVLRNAVQASPERGCVRVRTEARGADHVALCVDDEGPGFPNGAVARIFEPFYTTRASGTGVGLAVVRRLVEACGGRVEAQSSPEGGARIALVFARSVEHP